MAVETETVASKVRGDEMPFSEIVQFTISLESQRRAGKPAAADERPKKKWQGAKEDHPRKDGTGHKKTDSGSGGSSSGGKVGSRKHPKDVKCWDRGEHGHVHGSLDCKEPKKDRRKDKDKDKSGVKKFGYEEPNAAEELRSIIIRRTEPPRG